MRGFKKVKHSHRQYSFDNVFDFNELLRKWEERLMRVLQKRGINKTPEYVAELKIDGLKAVLDIRKRRNLFEEVREGMVKLEKI